MKVAAIILAVSVAVFGILGLVAPKDFHLKREIVVHRPKDQVFSKLKQLQSHFEWNAWLLKDPQVQSEIKGTDGTVGARASWKSENLDVGTAEQEILEILEGQRVQYEIRYQEPFEASFYSYFTADVVGENRTLVVAGMKDYLPFPENVFSFVANILFGNKAKLQKNMDESLSNLKTIVEQKGDRK